MSKVGPIQRKTTRAMVASMIFSLLSAGGMVPFRAEAFLGSILSIPSGFIRKRKTSIRAATRTIPVGMPKAMYWNWSIWLPKAEA